jgi:putative tricarboxylic transport membrane protein
MDLLNALMTALEPSNLLFIAVGVLGGLLVGGIPGLTATLAISLLLPFTFMLDPEPALLLLLGIYVGGTCGGAFTAILIRTPGTPGSVATSFDGYPLTQKGEGGRALGIAVVASVVGGLISVCIMILLSPTIGNFALKFSSAEYFALAVFGLTIIFSVSGDSMFKGMLSGALGLLFATVGVDSISPFPRFTFGSDQLIIGLPFLPVIIGLFAVSEVFRMLEAKDITEKITDKINRIVPKLKELNALKWLMIKSGIIGSFIGALPGAGANIAAFVSYGEAKRTSKNPEEFGKGKIEGVAASEAANSAVPGGALIPTLTLGIPGDAVTAVLLGAFIIQGLEPGPLLFRENKDLMYTIYIGLFIAIIFLLILGLSTAKVIFRLSTFKRATLIPIIAAFSLIGAYAPESSLYHMGVALFFGVIGYLLEKFNFSVAPMALAFILGPIIERSFRTALIRSDSGYGIFVSSPISAVLLLSAVVYVIYVTYRQFKNKSTKNRGINV